MPHYVTKFRGRVEMMDADDELEAAKRRICGELLDRDLPRGATYELRVALCPVQPKGTPMATYDALAEAGKLAAVDVGEKPGRGSTVARWA